ncbi:MAG: hypothetical protein ABJG78_14965 [Cyclobacteriaceae bacterium]
MKVRSNWDFVSVEEDDKKKGNHLLSVGVYEFDEEIDFLRSEDKLIVDLDVSDEFIRYSVPIESGSNRLKFSNSESKYIDVRAERFNLHPAFEHSSSTKERTTPRFRGYTIGTGNRQTPGALGGIVESVDSNNKKTLFAITAAHVLGDSIVGQDIVSPYDTGFVIGHLCWSKNDPDSDIALIEISDERRVSGGSVCGLKIEENLASVPPIGHEVRLCSATHGRTKQSKIKSLHCCARLFPRGRSLIRNVIKTGDMASPGDSGSLVINERDEVVGLLVKDQGRTASFFMPLTILNNNIVQATGDHSIDFQFNRFIK